VYGAWMGRVCVLNAAGVEQQAGVSWSGAGAVSMS